MEIIYFRRKNGDEPARDWIEDQDGSIRPSIDIKLERLRAEGLLLLENGWLVPIKGKLGGKLVAGFYELKYSGKMKWRIAVFHDKKINKFVLISGWRKQRQSQPNDVSKAITFLKEYLSL